MTEVKYWWVFSVAVLGPLASFWIESAWVFQREIRHYQALIFYFDRPILWIVAGVEFLLTFCSLLLLQRGLGKFWLRWSVVLCFYGLWTYVAFLIMPPVYR